MAPNGLTWIRRRDVVGHHNRLPWPRLCGVRLVAAVICIALVERRVIDDQVDIMVTWEQHRFIPEHHMTEPSFLDAFAPRQNR